MWSYPPDLPRPRTCHQILERRRLDLAEATQLGLQLAEAALRESEEATPAAVAPEGAPVNASEGAAFQPGDVEPAPTGSEGGPPQPTEPPDDWDAWVDREVAFALYLEDGSFDRTEGRFTLDDVEGICPL